MCQLRAVARVVALLFFTVCLVLLLAGADFPPPAGFLLLVLLDLIAALAVSRRLPVYLSWSLEKRRWHSLRVAAEGAAVGLAFALLLQLVGVTGEPGIEVDAADRAIWLVVLASVGALAALTVYGLALLICRFSRAAAEGGGRD